MGDWALNDKNPIPFWGKSKPTRRYIPNYSLAYEEREGKLFCIITKTTMDDKAPVYKFEVKNREQVEKLKKIESIHELQTIEVVA